MIVRTHTRLHTPLRALVRLYRALDEELAAFPFACRMDGDCCRFALSGLRLYISSLEAIYLFGGSEPLGSGKAGLLEAGGERTCPFLVDGRCNRRTLRALGCRIYTCDSLLNERTQPIYERYHRQIRDLHRDHDLPYEYRDILAWCHDLDLSSKSGAASRKELRPPPR